jgi:hypothetical protein
MAPLVGSWPWPQAADAAARPSVVAPQPKTARSRYGQPIRSHTYACMYGYWYAYVCVCGQVGLRPRPSHCTMRGTRLTGSSLSISLSLSHLQSTRGHRDVRLAGGARGRPWVLHCWATPSHVHYSEPSQAPVSTDARGPACRAREHSALASARDRSHALHGTTAAAAHEDTEHRAPWRKAGVHADARTQHTHRHIHTSLHRCTLICAIP